MRARDLVPMLRAIAQASGLSEYRWAVQISRTAPDNSEDPDWEMLAEMCVYGMAAELVIYPGFRDLTESERVAQICHEVAHVVVHSYTTTAAELAGSKAGALTQAEERLCDHIGRLILSACHEQGVSFDAVTGG